MYVSRYNRISFQNLDHGRWREGLFIEENGSDKQVEIEYAIIL